MLPESRSRNQDAIRATLALLDLERQIQAEIVMIEALAALPAVEDEWDDSFRVGLGAPLDASECFEPPAWSAWLADRRQPD